MENKASLIAQYLRRLYNNHLTTCYGGNISIRACLVSLHYQ